ncbi:LysM peptidoglycan-binding domain-containing protein [Aquimarina sp. W85]|uniref:LysM peptidoglycan-binding domain-containing protein n=1 Tax=Aquimarina rhodophyticola TaxID=3342246 RepID=UPI0036711D28
MKKILFFCALFCMFTTTIYAQQYKSHKVAKGENVFRIAKRYNTTSEAIYRINPTAKDGIKEGQILAIPITNNQEFKTHVVGEGDTVYNIAKRYGITTAEVFIYNPEARNGINLGEILRVGKLPQSNAAGVDTDDPTGKQAILDSLKVVPEPKVVSFKIHKVERKETLYGIARQYNITIDEIKKHNKRLYSEEIKKRDKLRIPVYENSATVTKQDDSLIRGVSKTTSYTIQPKDTKFGIARKHGISVSDLEKLNPAMDPDFPIGMQITVPSTVFVGYEELLDSGFELYQIKPKETMFSLVRRLDISSDSLLAINPYIKDGLKAGMVITVPKPKIKDSIAFDFAEGQSINLERKLYNFIPKKIAVMLPFSLDSLNMNQRQDTEDFLKAKRGTRVALDFYSGVLTAIDSAKEKGITVELNVFDTKKNNNASYLKKIIRENNFKDMNAVIGPLYQANVELVAEELKSYDVPVFSPITKKESKLYGNFFQTRPSDIMLQEKVITYVQKDTIDKNIILIVQQGKKFEAVRQKLIDAFPTAKVAKIQEGNFLYEEDLLKVLDENKPNWVFLESDDIAMISNVTPLLNAKFESHKITLFTTDKNAAFENDSVNNVHLSNLHLHFPSIDKEYEDDSNKRIPFVERYKRKYGVAPNKYAVRGYDITYDILMRLGTADNVYQAATYEGTTEYVENKFNYAKKVSGGYYNKASYLIRFDENLKLTAVE